MLEATVRAMGLLYIKYKYKLIPQQENNCVFIITTLKTINQPVVFAKRPVWPLLFLSQYDSASVIITQVHLMSRCDYLREHANYYFNNRLLVLVAS